MRVLEKQVFSGPSTDRDSGAFFESLEFRSCRFEGMSLSITLNPALRSTVRNVALVGCEERGCSLGPAVVEDVLVDGLKTRGLFQAWGAVFKHVRLRGKVGDVMVSDKVNPALATPGQQRTFDVENAEYYSRVDWALDISEAEFTGAPDFRGVPARLVRRDSATQVVVTREKAMKGTWRTLDLSRTYWPTALEFLLEFGNRDVVLVAPKRHRKFSDLVDGLRLLRDAGVAEPD